MPDFCPYCHQPIPPHLAGRPRKIVDLDKAKVLLDQGLSLRRCAHLLGVSHGKFIEVIRAAGFDHRRSPVMALRSALARGRKLSALPGQIPDSSPQTGPEPPDSP